MDAAKKARTFLQVAMAPLQVLYPILDSVHDSAIEVAPVALNAHLDVQRLRIKIKIGPTFQI
jgi:hypothetical protein